MPEVDGAELCKAVRSLFDGYVYALLLTARDAKEHRPVSRVAAL